MKKCIVIYNPNSGKGKVKRYLDDIIRIIGSYDYDTDVIETKYKGHAIKIVKKLEFADLVMSFGGDGTFNEVMRGNFLRSERLVLAHIPVGTTNDIGVMFGYGKDILQNVKITLEGEIKKMDIGFIDKTPFVYVAGFGKYMDISYGTPVTSKKRLGYFAYLKEGVKAFFRKTKMYDISYVIDGNEYRGLFSLVLISSANHIAGVNNVYRDVKLDDNKFEVLFCNIEKRKDLFKSLYFLTKYDASRVPGLYFYRTDNLKVRIHDMGHASWGIDGEKLPDRGSVVQFKNVSGVEVMIPKKNIKKLFLNS